MQPSYLFNSAIIFCNQVLYALFGVLAFALVLIALGPGLIHSESGWQYKVFHLLCHQLTERSFFYHDHQMAVCARCLGIYGFFFISWMLMPLFATFNAQKKQWYVRILITTILINILDVVGNYFGIWTNTLISRFVLGALMSIAVVLLLHTEFFKLNMDKGLWKTQK